MQPAVGADDLLTTRSNNLPSVTSMILIYDVQDPTEDLKRFEEIEKVTVEKVQHHEPLEEREDELMRGMSGMSYPGYNMGFGKWLLDNHRYYDAYVTFQRVFNCLKLELHHVNKEIAGMFYRASYAMGICLQQLGFLDKAAYYLQVAIAGGQEYIAPYVEVLALSSHNRVCYFMNQLRSQAANKNEAAAKEVQRLEKVVADAENRHVVPENFNFGVLPLGYVLQHMFDAEKNCLLGATVSPMNGSAEHGQYLSNKDDIWGLNLHEMKDAIIYLHYTRAAAQMGIQNDDSFLCAAALV